LLVDLDAIARPTRQRQGRTRTEQRLTEAATGVQTAGAAMAMPECSGRRVGLERGVRVEVGGHGRHGLAVLSVSLFGS
jgi:elongation factor P--beta-lysine ligase